MNAWTWLRAEWDRVAGFSLVVAGAVLLFLGYRGVQTSPFLAEELAYIASGGLGGLFCLGLGVGLLVCAGLHDEWYKLDRIEVAIRGEALPDSTALAEWLVQGRPSAGRQPDTGRAAPVTAAVAFDREPAAERPGAMLALAMDWRATHRARALATLVLLLLLPLVLSTAGSQRARHTPDLDVATQGLALAAAGTALALALIAGYAVWLRARVVRREGHLFRDYLSGKGLAHLRRPEPAATDGADDEAARNGSGERLVVVAAGLRRFHRAGCPALAGLDASTVSRASLGEGQHPCGICGA